MLASHSLLGSRRFLDVVTHQLQDSGPGKWPDASQGGFGSAESPAFRIQVRDAEESLVQWFDVARGILFRLRRAPFSVTQPGWDRLRRSFP